MKNFLSLILVFFATRICAQDTLTKKVTPFILHHIYPWQGQKGINIGIIYHGRAALDIGIFISDLPKPKTKQYPFLRNDGKLVYSNQNIFLNAELTYDNRDIIIGPKAGYEYNYMIWTCRISDVCYINTNKNTPFDNRVLLEAGLTIFGWVNLCYGYSLPTLTNEINNINRHRVVLRVNLFPNS